MAILRLAALGVIVSMVAAQDVKEQCNTLLKTLLPSAAEVHTEGKNVTSEGPDPAVLKGFLEACPIMGPLPASAVQISAQLQKPEYASLKSMYSRLLFCKPETLVPSVRLIPHENKKSNKLKKVVTGFILGKNTQDDVDSSLATAEAANGGLDSTALPIAESILDKFDWKYLDGSWTKVKTYAMSQFDGLPPPIATDLAKTAAERVHEMPFQYAAVRALASSYSKAELETINAQMSEPLFETMKIYFPSCVNGAHKEVFTHENYHKDGHKHVHPALTHEHHVDTKDEL